MNINEIMQLIDKVSDSELNEFVLEEGNLKLTLKANRGMAVIEEPKALEAVMEQRKVEEKQAEVVEKTEIVGMPPAILKEENPVKQEKQVEGNVIKSPLVGTFYAAPAEDKPPFVSIGDQVKKGQVIGIVEAMKLMNEVESEFDGTVLDIVVNNGDMVEFGQPLVIIG
ncbi:MAG TPA: acetyl-CoA carboxylase biotin carboxyl carrier protein [Lachnospiraceae bacterium]|jgi:acetyl-CoA carboxylase biotin carboxyl carrier protein|nr:acetyl-CoA carboxylase biotin carboxyl carrier protein [Lachnospiraceae bacterium]HIS61846.1 acetyl-CoA carboxylase biotin carboxyl carrier protein [Candidatus Scybalomonas excrementigallinarum]